MIYSEQTNETLVNLTLLGNEKAYEALVVRYQHAVINSALGITRDPYLAEDAAQDAFVSAWMRLDSLRDLEKFGAWVCQIAKNRAKNIMIRNPNCIAFDDAEYRAWEAEENIFDLLDQNAELTALHKGIEKLSEKVRQVIVMHYFNGLSLAEIADKLHIPVGTVKYRLHDGREKLRKDLKNEMKEYTDETFVEKVMKKVEEIKLWRLRDNKEGFEKLYREVLTELDQLPESEEKHSALADVMLRGSWWIEGEKSEELMERIRIAAEKGRNEEVMKSLLFYERNKLSGKDLIELMRDKQIPRMQVLGYRKAEGYVWFWLAYEYFNLNQTEEGFAAYQRVLELLSPADVYYANALSAIRAEKTFRNDQYHQSDVFVDTTGENLRLIDGKLRFWSQPGYSRGGFRKNMRANAILYLSALCDAMFYDPEMKVGDVYHGSDQGSSLTFLSDHWTAETACGTFYDCEVWRSEKKDESIVTYYKRNIGIVRMEYQKGNQKYIRTLKDYHIEGGVGLIPLCAGNVWRYDIPNLTPPKFDSELVFEVIYFDGHDAIISQYSHNIMLMIDKDDWYAVTEAYRNRYVRDNEHFSDVSDWMELAKNLAVTAYQKTHTRVACEVMERIASTDPEFTPNTTQKGRWNFFRYYEIHRTMQTVGLQEDRTYSFEWKDMAKIGDQGYPLLYNHVYSILSDACGYLWNEDWKVGLQTTIQHEQYNNLKISTDLTIEDAGEQTTPAGSFKNCILLKLNISGMTNGWTYRGGIKEYYFAPDIGLIRAVHHYQKNTLTAVYELTEYNGTGKGYFPLTEGSFRRYEAIGLEGGFEASTEYTCCQNDKGELILLANCLGIEHIFSNSAQNELTVD